MKINHLGDARRAFGIPAANQPFSRSLVRRSAGHDPFVTVALSHQRGGELQRQSYSSQPQ
jgi:hypothetical protein